MNVELIREFQFLSQFNFDVRYKLDKEHIISDALSRLISFNVNQFIKDAKVDVLFIYNTIFIEMSTNFEKKIIKEYFINFV